MVVETKFSIGDDIYLLNDNKVVCGKVTGILFKQTRHDSQYAYIIDYGSSNFPETNLFSTKEDLLKHLKEKC